MGIFLDGRTGRQTGVSPDLTWIPRVELQAFNFPDFYTAVFHRTTCGQAADFFVEKDIVVNEAAF